MNEKSRTEEISNAVDEYLESTLEFNKIINKDLTEVPINNSDKKSLRMISMTLPISNLETLSSHLTKKLESMEG